MKKKQMAAVIGLAAVFVIGGSLAYFNQNLQAANVMKTDKFDTTVIELFNPEKGIDWKPGEEVNKDFEVENSGSVPMLVRVSFRESWWRDGIEFKSIDTRDKEAAADENAERNNKFESVHQEPETPAEGGNTEGDDSVVEKKLILGTDWLYNPEDGYYYYTKTLAKKGDRTGLLLDSVTLAQDTDMGRMLKKKEYSLAPDKDAPEGSWQPFPTEDGKEISEKELLERVEKEGKTIYHLRSKTFTDPDHSGYGGAEYRLSITAQTVQATRTAVREVFGTQALTFAQENSFNWILK